jgi:hypothetical protein
VMHLLSFMRVSESILLTLDGGTIGHRGESMLQLHNCGSSHHDEAFMRQTR